jgi:ferredoxin
LNKKVIINEDDCIGCGSCEAICPEVFKLDSKKGKSTVIRPEGGPNDLIEEAMEACPVSCISLVEANDQ